MGSKKVQEYFHSWLNEIGTEKDELPSDEEIQDADLCMALDEVEQYNHVTAVCKPYTILCSCDYSTNQFAVKGMDWFSVGSVPGGQDPSEYAVFKALQIIATECLNSDEYLILVNDKTICEKVESLIKHKHKHKLFSKLYSLLQINQISFKTSNHNLEYIVSAIQ